MAKNLRVLTNVEDVLLLSKDAAVRRARLLHSGSCAWCKGPICASLTASVKAYTGPFGSR